MRALWRQRLRPPRIAFLIGGFIGLAILYSVMIPLGEAPDEAPHFTVVRYIVKHGHLPSTEEEHEAFQPPLYYLLCAGLTFWADYEGYVIQANTDYSLDPGQPKNLLLHTRQEAFPYRGWALTWHILRLFSVACGAVTVWACYRIGQTVYPDRPLVGWLAAGLCAFTPQFLFMSGVMNNDNLAACLSAMLLLQIARIAQGKDEWHIIALAGTLLGLGVLSKLSVAVTAVPLAIALIWAARRTTPRWSQAFRRAIGRGSLAAGIALGISGWWFVRNWYLHGDFTGWSFILQTNALREGGLTPAVLGWLVRGLFRSFWLGWIGIALDPWMYWALLGMCSVAVAGLARRLIRRRTARDEVAVLGVLGLQGLLVFASLLKWTATVLGTDQARLLYPALPAIILFLADGILEWVPRGHEPAAVATILVPLAALAVVTPWLYIAPVHARPSPVPWAELHEISNPANVTFGDAIRLVGWSAPEEIKAGAWLPLSLYWEALRPLDENLWLSVHLIAPDEDMPLVVKDGSPSAGRDTTDWWKPGEIVPSHHRLPVPAHAKPGRYLVRIGLHPFGEWQWLPAMPDGMPLYVLTSVVVTK